MNWSLPGPQALRRSLQPATRPLGGGRTALVLLRGHYRRRAGVFLCCPGSVLPPWRALGEGLAGRGPMRFVPTASSSIHSR